MALGILTKLFFTNNYMSFEKKYKWYKLAEPDEFLVAEGIIMNLSVPDKQFCITQHKGKYYAFQSKCPHAGAHFEHGWINEDGCLVCPLHRFQFQLSTGVNSSGEGFSLVRYPIQVDEHGIWVGMPEQRW
jgi:nitrite reductase/ring-hydroxylating ferredoxin subunit